MRNPSQSNFARIAFTAAALAFEIVHLCLEYLSGGVLAHHLLGNPDLPAFSNWWGLIVIPTLAWFLVGRIERRIEAQNAYQASAPRIPVAIMTAFTAALAYGAALSFAFIGNYEGIAYIFFGVFAVSLLVPTYRAEYILGFVLGMTFTFGAVLPVIIAAVIASFSRLTHLIFAIIVRLIRRGPAPRPL